MLGVEDWAEIRRLHRAEGQPIKVIARVMGISKNTVKAALASDGAPVYRQSPSGPVVDPVEPAIRDLLRVYPTMPATVIAERIGWARGITVLKERVAELRPAYLPPDPASRTSYVAGEVEGTADAGDRAPGSRQRLLRIAGRRQRADHLLRAARPQQRASRRREKTDRSEGTRFRHSSNAASVSFWRPESAGFARRRGCPGQFPVPVPWQPARGCVSARWFHPAMTLRSRSG